jgi:hypothetical protein
MRRRRASMVLLMGALVVAAELAPAPARAWDPQWDYRTWGYSGLNNYCMAGNGMCVAACDYNVPGGFLLGKCYDHCYRGTAVCDASRIPGPRHYRLHARRRVDP